MGLRLVAASAAGLLAGGAVIIGDIMNVDGFSGRTGFWGLQWCDSFLDTIGGENALILIACIWAFMAFAAVGILSLFLPDGTHKNE